MIMKRAAQLIEGRTVTTKPEREKLDLDKDRPKMWHIYRPVDNPIALCGFKGSALNLRVSTDVAPVALRCVVCKDLSCGAW